MWRTPGKFDSSAKARALGSREGGEPKSLTTNFSVLQSSWHSCDSLRSVVPILVERFFQWTINSSSPFHFGIDEQGEERCAIGSKSRAPQVAHRGLRRANRDPHPGLRLPGGRAGEPKIRRGPGRRCGRAAGGSERTLFFSLRFLPGLVKLDSTKKLQFHSIYLWDPSRLNH